MKWQQSANKQPNGKKYRVVWFIWAKNAPWNVCEWFHFSNRNDILCETNRFWAFQIQCHFSVIVANKWWWQSVGGWEPSDCGKMSNERLPVGGMSSVDWLAGGWDQCLPPPPLPPLVRITDIHPRISMKSFTCRPHPNHPWLNSSPCQCQAKLIIRRHK